MRSTPRGQSRRREIVAVAERLFLTQGFSDTTMQMVAIEAGASKETLYRHFGNKEELFAEVVVSRAQRLKAPIEEGFSRPDGVADVLRALGTNLLECMTHPDVVSLMRIVITESHRDPALGKIFYAFGPERVRSRLTDYLQAIRARGEFVGADPGLAASIFLGAVASHTQTLLLVLKDPPPVSAVEIAERVDEVVAMFMQRYVRVKSAAAAASLDAAS